MKDQVAEEIVDGYALNFSVGSADTNSHEMWRSGARTQHKAASRGAACYDRISLEAFCQRL